MALILRDFAALLRSRVLIAVLLAPVVLVAAIAIISYRTASQSISSFGAVDHTYQVISAVDATQKSMLDVETATRGYVLTGDEKFLEPYVEARRNVSNEIEAVRNLTHDNPKQQTAITTLEKTISRKLNHAERLIAERKQSGFEPTASEVALGEGKMLMDQIRGLASAMKTEELGLLEIRRKQTNDYAYWMKLGCLGFLAADLVVLVGLLTLIVHISRLQNLVKVCAWTKRVQYDGKWMRFEDYLRQRFGVRTTHGISEDAAERMKAELEALNPGTKT